MENDLIVKDDSILKSTENIVNDSNNKFKKANRDWEKIVELIFIISACIAILSVAIITFFIFIEGVPAITKTGLKEFATGLKWKPNGNDTITGETIKGTYGIGSMILSSIIGTFLSIIVAVPIGLFSSVLLAEIAPKWVARIFRPCVELLAGIPSVVYGFFGVVVIIPFLQDIFHSKMGDGMLAMVIILTFMILPTIINISETSLRAVPSEYKEGSLALGATHIETIFKVLIPTAKSGILASIVLGIGRAIGETMAVLMVCGNIPRLYGLTNVSDKVTSFGGHLKEFFFSGVRPMTANIATEMSYAPVGSLHQRALFATGVILFVFIMLLNIVLSLLVNKVKIDEN